MTTPTLLVPRPLAVPAPQGPAATGVRDSDGRGHPAVRTTAVRVIAVRAAGAHAVLGVRGPADISTTVLRSLRLVAG